jgi:hypothetical protein
MSSLKCGNCGLVNFKSEDVCKRCKTALTEVGAATAVVAAPETAAAGFSSYAEQQQQEAAQPSGGVWKDQKKVVKHIRAPLPGRCLKCNSPQGVAWQVYTLKYYPAYNIALALFGFVRYLKVGVEVGLCVNHREQRRQKAIRGGVLLAASVALFLLSIVMDMNVFLIAVSLLLFFGSLIFLATVGAPVSVAKIKEPYIWLKGADEEFLNTLPAWNGGFERLY